MTLWLLALSTLSNISKVLANLVAILILIFFKNIKNINYDYDNTSKWKDGACWTERAIKHNYLTVK
jgi:hypothetical protein